ncbi:MAG: PocR ligand-binding domain-containing protein, partial [bacterium]|nr:PocR ligand-binding domain-containing protein [bacterium]
MAQKKAKDDWTIYDLDLMAFERILKKASIGLGQSLFLLDTEGEYLTEPPADRPPFCKYVLSHEEGCRRCRESLTKGHQRVMAEGKSSIFSCHAGMVKVTAPVWVNDRIVAVLNGCTSTLLKDGSHFPGEKFGRAAVELKIPEAVSKTVREVPKEGVSQTLDLMVAMANLIAETSAENLRTLNQVDDATQEIKRQNEKLLALYALNRILQSPLSLDEKLWVILASLTAVEGFGFNRAMLLLLNEDMTLLEGKMGVGPSTLKEATAYRKRRQFNREKKLSEMTPGLDRQVHKMDSAFNRLVGSLSFPTRDKARYPVRTLFQTEATIVDNRGNQKEAVDRRLRRLVGNVRQFVVVPLIENEMPIGVIVADNRFSKQRIDEEKLQILSVFASQAATAISNSKLYSILQEKIFLLADSNRQLQKAHSRIMNMERFSTMGSVAAGVAHEIKNPLNAIVIYLELLRKELNKHHLKKENIVEKLNVVEEEIERLSDMATEFLSYSNPAPLETSPIDVRILLEQVIRFLGYQAKKQTVVIQKHFSGSVQEICANHKQLKQAFINIILNALQVMPDGGKLKVAVDKIAGEA